MLRCTTGGYEGGGLRQVRNAGSKCGGACLYCRSMKLSTGRVTPGTSPASRRNMEYSPAGVEGGRGRRRGSGVVEEVVGVETTIEAL